MTVNGVLGEFESAALSVKNEVEALVGRMCGEGVAHYSAALVSYADRDVILDIHVVGEDAGVSVVLINVLAVEIELLAVLLKIEVVLTLVLIGTVEATLAALCSALAVGSSRSEGLTFVWCVR